MAFAGGFHLYHHHLHRYLETIDGGMGLSMCMHEQWKKMIMGWLTLIFTKNIGQYSLTFFSSTSLGGGDFGSYVGTGLGDGV